MIEKTSKRRWKLQDTDLGNGGVEEDIMNQLHAHLNYKFTPMLDLRDLCDKSHFWQKQLKFFHEIISQRILLLAILSIFGFFF